jgi:tetratricopeptide (TPR) repeat protein
MPSIEPIAVRGFRAQLNRARQLMGAKNFPAALGVFAAMAKQFPDEDFSEEYGRAAAVAGDFALAGRLWESALRREPDNAALLTRLSQEYGKISLFAKARDLCARAAALLPEQLTAQLSLASFLARTGAVAEARAAVNKCLALDPRSEQARFLSAQLDRRESKLPEAEGQFRELIAHGRDRQVVWFAQFELARLLDRTERFDEAMAILQEAKEQALQTTDVRRAQKTFDERREKAVRKARVLPCDVLETWNKSFPREAREPAPRVAFLGGHARSGTTLLERILDAHPSVVAGDELQAFQTVSPLVDVDQPDVPADGLNFLRRRYVANFTQESDPPGANIILIDKNPPATAYLPAFLCVFPELRVLVALRDPRDVIVSCYFQSLNHISHLTLERLVEHYCCIMDVWLAVREWRGLAWLETRYESIVGNVRGEGARVTAFLGLPWHENQDRFHEENREKPVMSINYNDVTQPVYPRAVGRWRAYEKYLAPILPVLEPYCKRFGYP